MTFPSVRFSRTTQIKFVPPMSEMHPSVKSTCHYSDADFETMQRDTVLTIRAVRNNRRLNEDEMTERGLESLHSPDTFKSKRQNRDDVINAVLDEQDRLWAAGNVDADMESIASASRAHSRIAIDQALELGSSDAAFVKTALRLEARASLAAAARTTFLSGVLGRARDIIPSFEDEAVHHQRASKPSRRHTTMPLVENENESLSPMAESKIHRRAASLPGNFQRFEPKYSNGGRKCQQQN